MPNIIGCDEAGTGAWAGPFLVCAVEVPSTWSGVDGLTDSKELTFEQRRSVYAQLQNLRVALMMVTSETVDRMGLGAALKQAHADAILALTPRPTEYDGEIIIDGNVPPRIRTARAIPKADKLYPAVSAASIIAKVNRDQLMLDFHRQYPVYGFDAHVGYGTKQHRLAIQQHGICPIHRKSYRPIAALLQGVLPGVPI